MSIRYLLLLACIISTSTIITVEAQSYTGVLKLDPIPSQIKTGSTVTFSGQLGTTSGHIVPGATIYIKDDVDFGGDTVIGTVTTDENGQFGGTWTAQPRSSGAWDFYAVYDGTSNISKARSTTYNVNVSSYDSGSSHSSSSSSSTKYSTQITLYRVPSSIYAGDTITFTGKLTSGGQPLANKLVKILEDDPFSRDQRLGSKRTDSNGYFSVTWNASAGLIEKDFDVYAVFDGDSKYKRDRSSNQEMSVLKHGGSIILDSFPRTAKVGEVITFSGTLTLDGSSTEGKVVYIKDEDLFTGDDLLATGYVDSLGRFSANWFADYADEDSTVDVYAVYEGNYFSYRLTTCDKNPTRSFGGACPNTIPLRISGSLPTTPPNYIPTGSEYMELFYSLPFYKAPHVAIVPNPDSYKKVSGHIIPIKEGILMWKSLLENKYDGNWDVTFEVVAPGYSFNSKPDVIVNLDTHDDHAGCADYSGVAYPDATTPIQTHVCSTHHGKPYTNADVAATAGHEFIHAVGLGHTFNKKGDLMCSVEDGVPTCERSNSKSKTPSSLNLEAVAKIYGSDGWLNPNNHVQDKERFASGNSNPNIPSPAPRIPSSSYCENVYDNIDWTINKVLKSGWYVYWKICSEDISYSFSTSNKSHGLMIFVLPPETDVKSFMESDDGSYYTCEEYEKTWHKKSNTCNIAPGSHIVLSNPEEDAIRINGWIANQ